MPRPLHPQTQSAASEKEVQYIAHLFEAQLDRETLRLTSAAKDISFANGRETNTFLSVGALGTVSPVEEGAELQAYTVAVSLCGIDESLIAIAQQEHIQGRRAKIYLALLDDNSNLVGMPLLLFAGRIDSMQWQAGNNPSITLTVKNPLADWERNKLRRYTDSDQKNIFPEDNFFEYINTISDRPLTWGS